jgi:hypothetical protein
MPFLKACLHDQSFHLKLGQNFVYEKFPQRKHCQSYPINKIKVWSKVLRIIGWVSNPSKFSDKVFDAGLHDQRKLWPSFWWKTLIV